MDNNMLYDVTLRCTSGEIDINVAEDSSGPYLPEEVLKQLSTVEGLKPLPLGDDFTGIGITLTLDGSAAMDDVYDAIHKILGSEEHCRTETHDNL